MAAPIINCKVGGEYREAYEAACAAVGYKTPDAIRELIKLYVAENESVAPADDDGSPRSKAQKIDGGVLFAVKVDQALKDGFQAATARLNVTASDVLRGWIENPQVLAKLPPVTKPQPNAAFKKRTVRRDDRQGRLPPHAVAEQTPLPDTFDGWVPIPRFLLSNACPPNSLHPQVSDYQVLGMPKKLGLLVEVNGELLGQSEVSVWIMLLDVMTDDAVSNYCSGVEADRLLDALNFSKVRGTSDYVWLKRTLLRLAKTTATVFVGEQLVHAGSLITIGDYQDDLLRENVKRAYYVETVTDKHGKSVDRPLGRLDKFDIYIPPTVIRMLNNKVTRSFVPLDLRRMDLPEMAQWLAYFLLPRGPILRSPDGFGATYEFMRMAAGKTNSDMPDFIKQLNTAMDCLAVVDQKIGGIKGWKTCDFKSGKGVQIWKESSSSQEEAANEETDALPATV